MRKICALSAALATLLLLAAAGSAAHAQATRTWVSGVGDDANPCSRTAPCKTFAGAISKTAAGGIINVMDPGAYGAVTITKAITIQNEGNFAGILNTVGSGIVVNAGMNDAVTLRGLSLEGAGLGTNGIRFLNGLALYIENCDINRGSGVGIDFEPSGTSLLSVKNTVIRNFNFGGSGGAILIKPTAAGTANVFLENVQMERSLFGLRAENRSNVTVSNSQAVRNTGEGFLALSTGGGTVTMNLERSVATLNGTGVLSDGLMATVRISNVLIAGNTSGLVRNNSGAIVSYGNNTNPDGGTPSSTTMQQ